MNRTLLALVLASAMIPSTAPAQDVLAGAERYIQHCATCHGLSGTGDGPTAAILTLQPTDLTALASAEGGVFPVLRVVRRIDGRDPLVAHGSPMPIFGGFLDGGDAMIRSETGQPVLTVRGVADLVAYLQSIQD